MLRLFVLLCLALGACDSSGPGPSGGQTTTTSVKASPTDGPSVVSAAQEDEARGEAQRIQRSNAAILSRIAEEAREAEVKAEQDRITEIYYGRSDGNAFGIGISYSVKFYADGRAYYSGGAHGKRDDHWQRASIETMTFERLAERFEDVRFFEMERHYDPGMTDVLSRRTTSVRKGDDVMTVTNSDGAGPGRLESLEAFLDDFWRPLNWQPCRPDDLCEQAGGEPHRVESREDHRRRLVEQLEKDRIVGISFERIPCTGECPRYQVDFYVNGKAIYQGHSRVERMGVHRAELDRAEFVRLTEAVSDMNFFRLEDVYCTDESKDIVLTVTVRLDSQHKQVKSCADDSPAVLTEFVERLEQIQSNLSWEKCDPPYSCLHIP